MGGFLPRLPASLEHLDLLLLTVAQSRKVRQDGIHFPSLCCLDPTLAAYVGEQVIIRYDLRHMAEIRVFHQQRFLCRATSPNWRETPLPCAGLSSPAITGAKPCATRCTNAHARSKRSWRPIVALTKSTRL
jgi:Mu transposase, C-terminal